MISVALYQETNTDKERDADKNRPAGTTDDRSERRPEHEGKQSVGDRDDSGDVKCPRVDRRALVRGTDPPSDQRHKKTHDCGNEQRADGQLDDQPPGSRYSL